MEWVIIISILVIILIVYYLSSTSKSNYIVGATSPQLFQSISNMCMTPLQRLYRALYWY